MNRKLKPTKSPYQLKDQQVDFLLEDIEKNLEEYKKTVERNSKRLAEVKKYCKEQKIVTKLLQKKRNSQKNIQ